MALRTSVLSSMSSSLPGATCAASPLRNAAMARFRLIPSAALHARPSALAGPSPVSRRMGKSAWARRAAPLPPAAIANVLVIRSRAKCPWANVEQRKEATARSAFITALVNCQAANRHVLMSSVSAWQTSLASALASAFASALAAASSPACVTAAASAHLFASDRCPDFSGVGKAARRRFAGEVIASEAKDAPDSRLRRGSGD
mmetsp:Transcript_15142/g.49669  ORF Transcript_15142/g.49669 Transcript_15142/m.49669 type:complete len:203 (-) Transcript_15142:206-814(-)